MREVRKIPLSKLLKLETRGLVENVVRILEKHNPEALRLKDFNDILQDQKSKVQTLIDSYGTHEYTEEIGELHEKRLKYASLIVMQVESLGKKDCLKTQQLVMIAKRYTKPYLTSLRRKNLSHVNSQILYFFEILKLDNNSEDRKAFEDLGLQHYLDDLENTNREYEELFKLRSKDIQERPPTGGVHIEREAQKILRLFFEQINSYQQIFKDIDYQPLIEELNAQLTKHSKNIKTRIATNKRRARKKAEAAEKLKAETSKAEENETKGE